MIPRTDDQVMLRLGLPRSILHVPLVKRKRPRLVSVVMSRDRQDSHTQLFVLLRTRHHRIVIIVGRRMLEPLLEYRRRIAHPLVVFLKCAVRLVHFPGFCRPKRIIPEGLLIPGSPARERQPLHVVRIKNVVLERKIDSRMRRGGPAQSSPGAPETPWPRSTGQIPHRIRPTWSLSRCSSFVLRTIPSRRTRRALHSRMARTRLPNFRVRERPPAHTRIRGPRNTSPGPCTNLQCMAST